MGPFIPWTNDSFGQLMHLLNQSSLSISKYITCKVVARYFLKSVAVMAPGFFSFPFTLSTTFPNESAARTTPTPI